MALDYKSSLARYRRYMQLVQQKPLVKASLYVIFSLVLLIVLLLLALRPTLITIAGLAGEIKTKNTLAEQLNDKILRLQQASNLLNQNKERLEMLDEAIPETTLWNELATQLESLATESGLILTGVSVGPAQIQGREPVVTQAGGAAPVNVVKSPLPEGISSISFSVSATGEYEQLKTFIETVEKFRRVPILTEARIFRDESGQLAVTVTGVAGYAKKEN